VFFIFNNRGNAAGTVNSDPVPNMLNCRLSVRDYTGGTGRQVDDNGQPIDQDFGQLVGETFFHNGQAVTHGLRASVFAKMWNENPNLPTEGTTGHEPGWGYFKNAVEWEAHPTDFVDEGYPGVALRSEPPILLCAVSGILDEAHGNTPDIIMGTVNNGEHNLDSPDVAGDNFAKVMLHLLPNDDAVSGELKWRTRVSYQFY
jgi:hypothetical protein